MAHSKEHDELIATANRALALEPDALSSLPPEESERLAGGLRRFRGEMMTAIQHAELCAVRERLRLFDRVLGTCREP